MLKSSILLVVTIFILLQTAPGFCAASKTTTFQVSVTIPEHVILNIKPGNSFSNNPYQLVQTQTVIRNNKNVHLTSLVVP